MKEQKINQKEQKINQTASGKNDDSAPKTWKDEVPIVPMINEDGEPLGAISINNAVVVRIVSLAAKQVDGVVAIGGGGFVDKVLSGKGNSGVRVQEDDHGNYAITLPVTLQFGTKLVEVAYNVQAAVRDQVAKMTNKSVASVDVIIEDIKIPEHKEHKTAETNES